MANISFVFVENGKVKRGRPAHTADALKDRIVKARQDSRGRYNPAKSRNTYIAKVTVQEDGSRLVERIPDPR